MRFARHQLWLAADIGGGVSRAAVLHQVARTAGKTQTEAAAPDLPACFAHVWEWFCTLMPAQAGDGMPGPAALVADIEACFGMRPTASETQLLLSLFALVRRQVDDTT